MSKRSRIGNRYVTRTKDGRFKTNVSVGRSLSADRRRKSSKTPSKSGRGHQGDYRAEIFEADWYGRKVKDLKQELQYYDDDMPIVVRKGIGWEGYMNSPPRISTAQILADGSDDYPQQREQMRDGTLDSVEAVTIGREGYDAESFACETCGCKDKKSAECFGCETCGCGSDEEHDAESFGAESRFDKLANKVAKDYESKGYSDKEAMEIGKRVAYSQGVKKYGKAGMTRLSKEGRKKSMKKSADSYSLNAESGQVNNMSWQNSEPYATLEGYNPIDSIIASPPLGRGVAQEFGAEFEGQGYDDKMDESMGMRHRGKHKQSMKDRRDEASAMDKRHSKMHRKYDDVMTMDAEYDSPYGTRQTTDFGIVGMGNDFAQNRAETFGAEGGSEFMTGARYGAGAVVGITGATIILGTVMNLLMRK